LKQKQPFYLGSDGLGREPFKPLLQHKKWEFPVGGKAGYEKAIAVTGTVAFPDRMKQPLRLALCQML